jgi:hypothetical protein
LTAIAPALDELPGTVTVSVYVPTTGVAAKAVNPDEKPAKPGGNVPLWISSVSGGPRRNGSCAVAAAYIGSG